MKIGKTISDLRDNKGWSQYDLAKNSDVSKVMIGKYERDEATPSIQAAKRMADALGVTLDRLVGEGVNADFSKKDLERFKELLNLEEDKKNTIFDLIDTYIRDAKARQAYGSA